MTGYTRKDTTNNIADGNIINAADLDNEFDGVQAAFHASTGHTHDGTAAEGAAITKIGPVQDVLITTSAIYPKTTNTVDLGTSSLKYKDAFIAGNETVGGTLAVTGVATLTAQPVLSSLTASQAVFTDASKGLVSNAITGTGNVVMSTSPTLVTPILGTPTSGTVTNLTGTASININGTVGATTANTVAATTLTTSSTVTLNGGTANGVAYLDGSKVLTTGSALTFDGSNVLGMNNGSSFIIGGNVSLYGDANQTVIRGRATNGIVFQGTDGSEQMRLTSTGLGIGTSSPGVKLDISGTGAVGARVSGSTTASLILTAGSGFLNYLQYSSGGLQFYQATTGINTMLLDASGNLGLGVTPSAWALAGSAAMQIKNASIWGYANSAYVLANGYTISDGNINYIASDAVTLYKSGNGQHSWSTAPSGTAGTTATLTQLMTLDASGNLGVGTTSPSEKLHVVANAGYNATFSENSANKTRFQVYVDTNEVALVSLYDTTAKPMTFYTSGAKRATIDTSGNLGLGVTPSAWAFRVAQQIGAAVSISAAGGSNSSLAEFGANRYLNSSGNEVYIGNNYATLYQQNNGAHAWYTAPSGTAGNTITFTQAMTLDASGNLLVGRTSGTGANLDVYESASNDATIRIGNAQNIAVTAIGKQGATTYGATTAGDAFLYADNSLSIMSDNASGVIKFSAGGNTERARIDSSGNLLVGDTVNNVGVSRGYFLTGGTNDAVWAVNTLAAATTLVLWNKDTVNDNQFATFSTETAKATRGSITYNRAGGLVAYNVTSDYRAKDIYGPVTDSGALIDSVPVYMGKMKGATQERPMFIAHEVPAYAHTGEKDAVDKDGNPLFQQMDASALIPVMWAEIQSLRKRLTALEAK